MVVTINNKNNANNTAVMRVLTQPNTVCYDKWAKLIKSLKTHTPQQYVTTKCSVNNTLSPCHCPEIMWAFRRRNTRISSDFVMRFLQPSVKRCARQKPVMPAHWSDLALRVPVEGTQASAVVKTPMDLTLAGCCATPSGTCSFQTGQCHWKLLSWKRLKLGPETLLTQAKTICTFHNFSSWYNFRSTSSLVLKQLI